ncbi:annexin-2 receptor-like [Nycticebus coucang]|uniref:annexin-2 receptor-like n=1 Tax=Nycticebus coucang TaxID=9470 RepID=UPI00234E1807|nr:annexin-2 receptor-like [Nycticebus coucang]
MEPHFLDLVASPEVAPESRPAPNLNSDDLGPRPLAWYPVLGECSSERKGLELLSSPPWRMNWVRLQNGRFPGVPSTVTPLGVRSAAYLWSSRPLSPGGEVDSAEEADSSPLLQLPLAGSVHPGDTQQDTEASQSGHLSEFECGQPCDHNSGSLQRGFSRPLAWARGICRALFWALWRGCLSNCGTKQPQRASGAFRDSPF